MRFEKIHSVARNAGYLVVGHGVTTALQLAYVIILARLLEPNQYGILIYSFSWYLAFISLTYLGLDVVLGREIGRDRHAAGRLVGSTLALRLSAALVVAILSIAVAAIVEPDTEARRLILVLTVAMISRAVWLWCMSAFTAFENTRPIFVLELIFRPIEIATVIFFLWFVTPQNIIAVGVIHAALWTVQVTIALSIMHFRFAKIVFYRHNAWLGRLIVEGIPGAIYTFTVIWFFQAPTVLFRQFAGPGDTLGHFSLAMQIVGYLCSVPYLVGTVALPALSRSATKTGSGARNPATVMLVLIPLGGVLLGTFALFLAPAIAALVFGELYRETGIVLGTAMWLLTPIGLAIGLQQVLFAERERQRQGAIASLLAVAVMVALYGPLTEAWSYRGALLATGMGATVWALGVVRALAIGGAFRSIRRESTE